MKLLFVSDSFKGSLSSSETAALLEKAAHRVFPDAECTALEMADGGEGTAAAVCRAVHGKMVTCTARDPLGRPTEAFYALLPDHTAVIEMAAASGLPLLKMEERNPLLTSTWGTGDLIRKALDDGCRRIAVAIGGSATSEGGMGCLAALGAVFLDEEGRELEGRGCDLIRVSSIDLSHLDPRLSETEITVMCDVRNPLCGKEGAVMTFAEQKGADEAMRQELEEGMCRYRDVIRRQFHQDPDQIAGAGAAGGLGTALAVLLGGKMRSGIETVLELVRFDDLLRDCDLAVTGEGCTDWQSCCGKVMQGVGEHCQKAGVPCIALSAVLGRGWQDILGHGIGSIMTTADRIMTLEDAMAAAHEKYEEAAVRMFLMIRTGMLLAGRMESEKTA